MKKCLLFIFLSLLFLGLLAGCREESWEFKEPMEEIVSIEIVSAEDSRNYTVLKTLSEEKQDEFLEQFQKLRFHKVLGDPISVYGTTIKITYESGLYEMICEYSSEYVKDGNIRYRLRACNDGEAFNKLIEAFIETDG